MSQPPVDSVQLMAAAIAHFQADLAAADGPAYNPMAADPRLAALVLRIAARLAQCSRSSEDYGYGYETTALDDFIEDLEAASEAVLGPPTPTPGHGDRAPGASMAQP